MYRYRKGFVHAKVMIIDELLATVGTANVDMRSLYSNFELNAVLFEKRIIKRLVENFEEDLKDSSQLDPEQFKKRPRSQKAKESLANMLSPLL
ncbi:putative cardiolipin synthase YwiE [compost metagenome]